MNSEIRNDFWNSLAKSPFVMLRLEHSGGHAEPMTAMLDEDAHHVIWFWSSRKNRVAPGGRAMAQFMSKGHDLFACLSGTISKELDGTVADRLWSNAVEAWFPDGRNDPDLVLLRFDIEDGEVWTSELGLKGLFKLLTGKAIKRDEAGEHAAGTL